MARVTSLQEQRDEQRFSRAIDYVVHNAHSIKKITSSELAQLNQMLTESSDPWRSDPVEIQILSGQRHSFNIVSNPTTKARDLLGTANQRVGNGDAVEAAVLLYVELVLSHLFRDANRRTAVLAAVWVLGSAGISVSARDLLDIPLGDLRNKRDRDAFTRQVAHLVASSKS